MNLRSPFGPNTCVGFIGLGSMGLGMAQCLVRAGYTVHVYGRRAQSVMPLVQAGATSARSPAELGHECDIIFLSLPDAAAVGEILFGAEGLAHAIPPGSVVVDTSTIAADSARDFGARLKSLGIWYIDAPVSGGQQGAEQGTLNCMAGGPEDVIDACRGVMAAFCKTVTRVGELGAGQTVKACNQVAVAGALLGVADAVALAQAQGVDPAVMRDILLASTARSFALEKQALRIAAQDFKPGFRAALMRKDLGIALATADAKNVELPAAKLAHSLLEALCDEGRGDEDWIAIAKVNREQA